MKVTSLKLLNMILVDSVCLKKHRIRQLNHGGSFMIDEIMLKTGLKKWNSLALVSKK